MVSRGAVGWVAMALAALVACAMVAAHWLGVAKGPLFTLAALVLVALVSVPVVIITTKQLDEVAREAHRFAWYHGGSWGAVQGLLAVMATAALAPKAWLEARPPAELLINGALAVCVVQVAGYLLVWAIWWLRHR